MIKDLIRTIPDYPKPGIMFRDITTLLQDAEGLRLSVEGLAKPFADDRIAKVVGIEARGFILGGAVAVHLGVGYVPVRKKGKLPFETLSEEYELEYGTDSMEIHVDSIAKGERVLLVDDLIATGGTAEAAAKLIERCGGVVASCSFIVDLPDLGGRKRIEDAGHPVHVLCEFEGE